MAPASDFVKNSWKSKGRKWDKEQKLKAAAAAKKAKELELEAAAKAEREKKRQELDAAQPLICMDLFCMSLRCILYVASVFFAYAKCYLKHWVFLFCSA